MSLTPTTFPTALLTCVCSTNPPGPDDDLCEKCPRVCYSCGEQNAVAVLADDLGGPLPTQLERWLRGRGICGADYFDLIREGIGDRVDAIVVRDGVPTVVWSTLPAGLTGRSLGPFKIGHVTAGPCLPEGWCGFAMVRLVKCDPTWGALRAMSAGRTYEVAADGGGDVLVWQGGRGKSLTSVRRVDVEAA